MLLFQYVCGYEINAHFYKLVRVRLVVAGPAIHLYTAGMNLIDIFFAQSFIVYIQIQFVLHKRVNHLGGNFVSCQQLYIVIGQILSEIYAASRDMAASLPASAAR